MDLECYLIKIEDSESPNARLKEKAFVCSKCGKSFGLKETLKKHFLIHNDQKPFICNICGKGFARNEALKTHVLNHSGEKPFACQVCGKSFARKTTLEAHSFVHGGQKPHQCDVCGDAFTEKRELREHILVHFRQNPTCKFCGKSFARKRGLKQHIKLHCPYLKNNPSVDLNPSKVELIKNPNEKGGGFTNQCLSNVAFKTDEFDHHKNYNITYIEFVPCQFVPTIFVQMQSENVIPNNAIIESREQ